MIKTHHAIIALATLSTITVPAASTTIRTVVYKASEEAQKDTYAYDIVEGLTTEIGPRQGGTEAARRRHC